MSLVQKTNGKDRRGESADDRKDPAAANHHPGYLYGKLLRLPCVYERRGRRSL